MRALRAASVLLALSLSVWGGDPAAEALIAKVLSAQETSGFRVRARLVRGAPGADKPEVTQLLIKGRREGDTTEVLYEVLWPTAVRGRALVVRRAPGKPVTGFLFDPPDRQRPLSPDLMRQPLFGTDFSVEDVVDEFWSWPDQRRAGEEAVGGRACQVLESRPGPGAATAYSLVRSWVAPDLALPLRVEKYGKDGSLARRFTAESLMKQGGRWVAAKVTVVPAGGRTRTLLEGTKSERDLTLPASDFTVEALRKAAVPAGATAPGADRGKP